MAKCSFSEKFKVWALAEYMRAGGNPAAPYDVLIATKAFTEVFDNVDQAVEEFGKMMPGAEKNSDPGSSSSNVIDIDLDNANLASYYTGGVGFMQMQSKFRKKMLAATVFNLDTQTGEYEFIDGYGVDENNVNIAQKKILEYKAELINSLRAAINKAEFPLITVEDLNDIETYTSIVNETINAFADYMSGPNKSAIMQTDVYDDFVILKNFDKLIKGYASYIDIDESYEKAGKEGIAKYSFTPKVKHFTGFSTDEGADALKQMSNLAETILAVACDVEENGRPLNSIGVSGFNGAMGTLKEALLYGASMSTREDARAYRDAYSEGAGALLDKNNPHNILNFINDFINTYKSESKSIGDFESFRQVYLHNKLRGIAKYLLDEKTPAYIKNMFIQMFMKSEPTSYRAYSYDRDMGSFKGDNLRSRMQVTQKFAFENVIKGGITLLNSDSRAFSKALTDRYKFKFSKSGKYETLRISDGNRELTLKYKVDENGAHLLSTAKENIKLIQEGDETLIKDIMRDAYSYIVPDSYKTCITGSYNFNENEDFAPFVAIAAQEALKNIGIRDRGTNFDIINFREQVDLSKFNSKLLEIGQRLGVIFGNSTKSTIKSLSGSTLPLFGLTSMEYNWRSCLDIALKMEEFFEKNGVMQVNPWTNSFIGLNEELLMSPQIRSDIECNGQIKAPTKLSLNELNKVGMIDDFLMPLLANTGKNDDAIYLQHATFSDKARQFLMGYRLNVAFDENFNNEFIKPIWKNSDYAPKTLGEMLTNAMKSKVDRDKFSQFIRRTRVYRYSANAFNILGKYKVAFPEIGIGDIQSAVERYDLKTLVSELEKVDKFLLNSNLSINDVKAAFRNAGVEFINETDAYKPAMKGIGNVRINETLLSLMTAASTQENWNARNAKNMKKFAADISTFRLNGFDRESKSQIALLLDEKKERNLFGETFKHNGETNGHAWGYYNPDTREYKFVDGDRIHPLAEVYFLADMFLSNEFNAITLGEIWAHPNKNKSNAEVVGKDAYGKDIVESGHYLEFSEASRLVNQIKRSVINGSTIHPFAQNIKDADGNYCGVTDEIDIAVIEDNAGLVFTPLGVDDKIDSQDGSGWYTALEAMLENNSLIDAAAGENKKTILHDIDPLTGTPVLLKWAVYSLSNMVRRNGMGSNANVESIVRRAYSKSLSMAQVQKLQLDEIYKNYLKKNKPILIKDQLSLQYKELERIEKVSDLEYRRIYTNAKPEIINIATASQATVDGQSTVTLYGIDQLFGGANTYKQVNDHYEGTEASVDLLAATAIAYDLRDRQIAYFVNKSAMKVGHRNMNSSKTWTTDIPFDTFRIHTKFGGLMMDADHDLDHAEVTEMSQMISALIEDGHYPEQVEAIYKAIGEIALSNDRVRKYVEAVNTNDRDKLREIVGKSLIASFESGNKDTIGLANAFIRKVSKELENNPNIKVNIPFSDGTIFGAVMADVTSVLSKAGIRRKHPGLASVLNPSHDMAMYFNIGGKNMLWDQANEECKSIFEQKGFTLQLDTDGKYKVQYNGVDINVIDKNDKFISFTSWQELARNATKFINVNAGVIIDGLKNPFWDLITSQDVDFEDTLIIEGPDGSIQEVYVNNWITYDNIRNLGVYDGFNIYRHNAAARNLRGTDTKFTVNFIDNGKIGNEIGTFSYYNIDSVRVAHYLNSMDIDPETLNNEISILEEKINNNDFNVSKEELILYKKLSLIQKVFNQLRENGLSLDVNGCNILTQNFLEQLDLGKRYSEKLLVSDVITEDDNRAFLSHQECFKTSGLFAEIPIIASSYNVRPAEIMLGRYQMHKLGLDKGDQIHKIKEKGYLYFKEKLANSFEIPSLISDKDLSTLYDKVIYHNGKAFLVKIEKDNFDYSNSGITITDAPEANIVGDDLRWESNVIISGENKDKYHFSKISDGQKEYTLIKINEDVSNYELGETPLFDELLASEYFDDFYRNNTNDSNITWIDIDYEYFGSEEARVDRAFEILAKNRYEAFKRGIQFIGARIPTQAMQSFMPFEVICFLDDDQNKAYVPKANTHIEGSDYDIDKLYLLAMTILDGGKITSGSNIQSIVGYDVASKLEKAEGSFSEAIDFPTRNVIKDTLLIELTEPLNDITSQKFISFVNRAIKNNDYLLKFEGTSKIMSTGEFNRRKKQLIRLLNKHAKTSTRIQTSDEVLKSKVFSGIYDVVLSAQNQLKAQITVDTCTGDLKDTASKTVSGNAEKKVSPDIPSSKYVMQVQNMLGKAVVGIGAVSLKTYFILSTANNIKASRISDLINQGRYYDAYALFNTMKIENPIDGKTTTIANTNLAMIRRALNKTGDFPEKAEWEATLTEMERNISYISTPEFLSGIISLAADNAKDLALPKLNATEDLVDLYTTATMLGIPFLGVTDGDRNVIGISEIMTSPIFNWLTKMGEDNIFNSYSKGRKTKDMIKVALRQSFKLFPNYKDGLKKLVTDYNAFVDKHNAEAEAKGESVWKHIKGKDKDNHWTGEFLSNKEDIKHVKAWVLTQVKASNDVAAMRNENKALANEEMTVEDITDALDMENAKTPLVIRWSEAHWYKVYKALEFYEELLTKLSPIQTGHEMAPELELLNSLSNLLSLVEEMSTLGAQGSINQGLKTNMRDFYNFKYKVENLINKELNSKEGYKKFSEFIAELQKTDPDFATELSNIGEFSMTKFLQDKDYADKMCIIMEYFKVGFNILDALRYSPHFFAMSKLVPVADFTMNSVSVMYETATRIADNLIKGDPNAEDEDTVLSLTQNDFDAIEDYINDMMIFEFLKQKDITLDLNAIIEETGANISTYETSKATNTTSRRELKLNDALSIASAKHIIESTIIPYLKSHEDFKNNKFVRDLNASADRNSMIIFALPIQMMEADKDETTRNLYMEYLTAFNELSRHSIGGTNLGDIFFLYNMITNKNSFGQRALTRIFEDLVDSKSTPEIISKYYDFIGELDSKVKTLNIRMDEVRYRIAKYSKGTKITSEKRLDLPGDFTLDLPFSANINEEVLMSTKSGLIDYKPITTMTSDEVLKVLANKINANRANKLVEVVDDENELVQSLGIKERGFIKDGIIYLNSSTFKAQGAAEALAVGIHEIAHLIVASIKARPDTDEIRQKFYQMFLRVLNDEKLMQEWTPKYPNRVGSDLAEEILCNNVETLLTNRISEDNQYQLQLVEDKILLNGIKDLFSGVEDLSDIMGASLQAVVENFTKDLFVLSDEISSQYIKGSQQLAAIKAYLFRQGEKLENKQEADKKNNLQQKCES